MTLQRVYSVYFIFLQHILARRLEASIFATKSERRPFQANHCIHMKNRALGYAVQVYAHLASHENYQYSTQKPMVGGRMTVNSSIDSSCVYRHRCKAEAETQ